MRGQELARIGWTMCQVPRKAFDRFIIMPLKRVMLGSSETIAEHERRV